MTKKHKLSLIINDSFCFFVILRDIGGLIYISVRIYMKNLLFSLKVNNKSDVSIFQ